MKGAKVMKTALNFFFPSRKGFTIAEFLLAFALLVLLLAFYLQIEKNMAETTISELNASEEMLQLKTSMNAIHEICLRSQKVKIINQTSRYSKALRLTYLENSINKTAEFKLELFTNILYEIIQGNSDPGTTQLAVGIGAIEFSLVEKERGLLLRVEIKAKENPTIVLKRSFFMRSVLDNN